MINTRKLISISGYNYTRLKRLGMAGDSFNDVITQILAGQKENAINKALLQGEPGLSPRFTSAAICKPNHTGSGEVHIG